MGPLAKQAPLRVTDRAAPFRQQTTGCEDDPERLDRLKHLQLESLAHHSSRLPFFVPLTASFVGFTVWGAVPGELIVGWIAAITVVLMARWGYARRAAADKEGDVDTALRNMVVLSFANGFIQGAGVALVMPGLTLEQKAIVTMVMVCLSAGAVSANASYSRSFFAWVIPMFASLSLAWALEGDVAGAWIAALLVLFPLAQTMFVLDNEKVLRESFGIRYQYEQLVQELKVQRQAVAHARDRAEEANRGKSRFLASASHDLRQPLHTLSLYSAVLSARAADERSRQAASEIAAAIGSLGLLLDALLDISKLDAGVVRPEPGRFSLPAMAERVASEMRPIAQSKGLALVFEAGAPVTVDTDPILLERVLRNLVDNAIKYTPAGAVTVQVWPSAGRARLSVKDTGIGIPARERKRIYEEGYQLSNPGRDRSRGFGLGLAIVKRLTELLGVELTLESEPGKGSTFSLSLPVVDPYSGATQASSSPEPHAPEALPAGLRVLVVDDERPIREGMRTLLETWDCEVILASGVDDALAALRAGEVDLVIADQRLRGHETGLDLLRQARTLAAGVPALLVSGDTAPGLQLEAEELGVTLLRKPVPESALRKAIAGAVAVGVR